MTRPPRVVIDTNLVLSALVFAGGRLAPLRLAWQGQRVLPLVSRATAAELIRALTYPKFKLAAHEQEELLADYLPYCKTVRIPVPPPATPPCRDAFDVPFLELALVGKADALVTGDKDLLCLVGQLACPILSAERFLETISARL
ncbi:putative toxin-antitoxin system toxin component, PIN family [Sulfuritalea sp.]|uniref:putative toxin-antitoxin system toxin component, PIN family n=1 Tax=Sulfuritalea sp. TaxID=2480090 RepID=UPI001ACD487C|nr:putative toxin-antitoxin system toxin component, PIN family [Sulfuritalea sp.]MBN8477293.1 putative toxin-antitoxin system toxin component, PIN family [Sulfuritalea sp.]